MIKTSKSELFLAVCLVVGAAPCLSLSAQERIPLSEAISKVSSPSIVQRKVAFATLLNEIGLAKVRNEKADDRVAIALIDLLESEVAFDRVNKSKATNDQEAEDNGEYMFSLIETVASLRDIRAANVLCSSDILTTGNVAIDGLSHLGPQAAQCIIRSFRKKERVDLMVAHGLASSHLLADPSASELSREERTALLSITTICAHDPEPAVRSSVVDGLALARDPTGIALVEQISVSDPYFVNIRGITAYPVRERAKAALLKKG